MPAFNQNNHKLKETQLENDQKEKLLAGVETGSLCRLSLLQVCIMTRDQNKIIVLSSMPWLHPSPSFRTKFLRKARGVHWVVSKQILKRQSWLAGKTCIEDFYYYSPVVSINCCINWLVRQKPFCCLALKHGSSNLHILSNTPLVPYVIILYIYKNTT